jgi:hypothetical protein
MTLPRKAVIVCCVTFASAAVYGQSAGYITAHIDPGRAGVFIDGKYVGPAANFKMARKYAVAAGEHEVKIIDPRYEEFTTKVTVTSGKNSVIKEKLKALPPPKPPFGRIRTLTTDKFAAVYINDKFYGHADEFSNPSQALLIPPGDYTIRIVPATGSPHEEKIKVEADKTIIVNAK